MLYSKSLLMAAVFLSLGATPALSEPVQFIEATGTLQADQATQPALRLTPDKSELIRLSQPAASVIIGNPAHINVLADQADTLIVIPRQPGASYFTVLNEDGAVIMQRHVIVASPQKNYLRVRRTCKGDDESCQSTSVYYCPDMCYEVALNGAEGSSASPSDQQQAQATNESPFAVPLPQADTP